MLRRYHHGHSVGVGVLLGLLLTRHGFALALCSCLVGVVAGRTWAWWATKAAVLGMALRTRARASQRLMPVYSTRAKARRSSSQSDDIPF